MLPNLKNCFIGQRALFNCVSEYGEGGLRVANIHMEKGEDNPLYTVTVNVTGSLRVANIHMEEEEEENPLYTGGFHVKSPRKTRPIFFLVFDSKSQKY